MNDIRNDLTIHHVCGCDELADAPLAGAARIISLLSPDASIPAELLSFLPPLLILRFDDAIRPEAGAVLPADEHIAKLLAFDAGAAADKRLVIHCTKGISRSTAALIILLAQRHPDRVDELFAALRALRPKAWPNSRMVDIADRLLGLKGTLITALRRHYVLQTKRHPEIARGMLSLDREIEVPVERPTYSQELLATLKRVLQDGSDNDPAIVEKLVGYLRKHDLIANEAREWIAGDHSKWPSISDLAARLAERIAWAYGIWDSKAMQGDR